MVVRRRDYGPRWESGDTESPYRLGGSMRLSGTVPYLGAPSQTGAYQNLCSWSSRPGEPAVPVVLSIDSYLHGYFATLRQVLSEMAFPAAPNQTGLGGGNWGAGTLADYAHQGMLRLRYGAHGTLKTRWIDIRSGQYQLPPVNQVTVDVVFYNNTSVATPDATGVVSASLAAGSVVEPRTPTFTGILEELTAPNSELFLVPIGAQYLSVRLGVGTKVIPAGNGLVVAGVVQPAVSFDGSLAITPQVFDQLILPASPTFQGVDFECTAGDVQIVASFRIGF